MVLREATEGNAAAIRDLVSRSMEASYSLGPSTIDAAVAEWFDDEAIAAKLSDEDRRLLVAERDGEVVGVADCVVIEEGEEGDVLWLHVDPDYRGEGIGEALFERTREALDEMGAGYVRGLVLANNPDGNAFYREQGFQKVGERDLEIDGDPYTERVYHERPREDVQVATDDGREVYVDRTDADRGSLAPFYRAYTDPELANRYGYQCGHCESLATSVDSMGRIECSDCGNTRKPTRWDAAYL